MLRTAATSVAARAAAECLVELLSVPPDNLLQMPWFERARRNPEGSATMAYCDTRIMPMFEPGPASPTRGRPIIPRSTAAPAQGSCETGRYGAGVSR